MDRAVSQWLSQTSLPPEHIATIAEKLNKSYTIYGDMLLLPPTALQSISPEPDQRLLECICKHLKVTHIAMNRPIPLHHPAKECAEGVDGEEEGERNFNALRSPSNFTPLYGNFGPSTCNSPPTRADFEEALWVTAKQNGIYQAWAPRWTMFSRGNISEKARLLRLPSVLKAAEERSTAVDLYAGIGYFAFSYVKAGLEKVLCWDLNAWSCEGLRRGARKNKWEVAVVDGDGWGGTEEASLVVFNESNEFAPQRVKGIGEHLPPIRHVNCGMLPNSTSSLELAVQVLDLDLTGWVHYHENFLVEEIEQRAEETRQELFRILEGHLGRKGAVVEVEYVNRLKSYAPGVMHCVVDLVIYPNGPP